MLANSNGEISMLRRSKRQKSVIETREREGGRDKRRRGTVDRGTRKQKVRAIQYPDEGRKPTDADLSKSNPLLHTN